MAPSLAKSLSRLTHDRLIDLCLEWLHSPDSNPYLASNRSLFESEEEDYLHQPAASVQELKRFYRDLKYDAPATERLSKKDIIDRIIDGDWRRGLSLSQLASIDLAYIDQTDTALRWTALKLIPLSMADSSKTRPEKRQKLSHSQSRQPQYPDITPSMFLSNLKKQISPLVKTFCTLGNLKSHPDMTILRMQILTGVAFVPSGTSILHSNKQSVDTSRVMYIALSKGSPYIYVSVSTASESVSASQPSTSNRAGADLASAKRFVLEAVPKAFSRPQERWALQSTRMTAKSLRSMCLMRGNGDRGSTGGVYSQFAAQYEDQKRTSGMENGEAMGYSEKTAHVRPTYVQLPTPPPEDVLSLEGEVLRRFGCVSGSTHARLSRFNVKISNVLELAPHLMSQARLSRGDQARKRKRNGSEMGRGDSNQPTHQEAANIAADGGSDVDPAVVSLSFSGSDVFAGLKQLALLGPEYCDVTRMPSWMTGEKGVSTLTV